MVHIGCLPTPLCHRVVFWVNDVGGTAPEPKLPAGSRAVVGCYHSLGRQSTIGGYDMS